MFGFGIGNIYWKFGYLLYQINMRIFFIGIVLFYCCSSQNTTNFAAKVFAQTFNLPDPGSPPPQISAWEIAAKQRISKSKKAASQIKSLADALNLPSKTVKSFQTSKIYLIIEQNDLIERHEISHEAAYNRLFGENKLMSVSEEILKPIPVGSSLDKFVQLVKVKGEEQVYIIRDGVSDIVEMVQFRNFGFSDKNVLEIQPCFIGVFISRYYLQ